MTLCTDSRVLQDSRTATLSPTAGRGPWVSLPKHNPGLVLDDQLSV